jgi:hypothetical protein
LFGLVLGKKKDNFIEIYFFKVFNPKSVQSYRVRLGSVFFVSKLVQIDIISIESFYKPRFLGFYYNGSKLFLLFLGFSRFVLNFFIKGLSCFITKAFHAYK